MGNNELELSRDGIDTDLSIELWCIDERRDPVEHPVKCNLTMICDGENPPLITRFSNPRRIRSNHRLMELETDMEPTEESIFSGIRQFRHLSGRAIQMADDEEIQPYPESLHGEKPKQGPRTNIESKLIEQYDIPD